MQIQCYLLKACQAAKTSIDNNKSHAHYHLNTNFKEIHTKLLITFVNIFGTSFINFINWQLR